ncbi:MAG TPA: hypothetical protein VKU02_18485 [Gemmataceae bacterium]|nr:hypothetical protein [Gemmataceae bacterium]
MQKALFGVITALLALACSSCGRSPKLYPATGKVTVNGTPAAGASVFFQRQGADLVNEQTIMGIVREDGSFSLVSGSSGEGAPPGEYDVFIEWRHRVERAKGPLGTDRLKGHYADRKHPRLHAVVNPAPTDLPPFDLTEGNVAKADLVADTNPGLKKPAGKPHFFINGKEVDPETAEKIMRAGPREKGVKITIKGAPANKANLFKKGDGEPDQKIQKSP